MNFPDPMPRELVLSENIDAKSVKEIISTIIEINSDDDDKEKYCKDWKRLPIKLYINSFGGSVYDGLALIDIIKASKTPVNTICIGSCMSMGLWIFISGDKRYIGHHGTLMFHDVSTTIVGKTEKIKNNMDELKRLSNMFIHDICINSGIKESELLYYVEHQSEWYVPAEKAIELKFADGYY